jgi:3D (Asp-Asp-Asp) domain-containing protein
MPHRRRAFVATIVALAIAQTLAFSSPKQAPPEVVVDPGSKRGRVLGPSRSSSNASCREGPAIANPVFRLRATAYNSMVSQTNAQPFVTATGQRTRWGIVAVSRDLLGGDLPYGSLVRLRDLGSFHNGPRRRRLPSLLDDTVFVVEDTMHPRKRTRSISGSPTTRARSPGASASVEVEVVRYGRDGPTLEPIVADVEVRRPVTWLASR